MGPQEIVTYGAGVIALVIIFGVFWARHKREDNLDERQQRAIDDRDETIRELNKRNQDLSDRYHKAVESHSSQVLETINTMRREQFNSMRIVHEKLTTTNVKLEKAEQELAACMAKHEECDRNVGELRALISKHIGNEATAG